MNFSLLKRKMNDYRSGADARPWLEIPHEETSGGHGNAPNHRFALWAVNNIEKILDHAEAQAEYVKLLEQKLKSVPSGDPDVQESLFKPRVRCTRCDGGWMRVEGKTVRCEYCNPFIP